MYKVYQTPGPISCYNSQNVYRSGRGISDGQIRWVLKEIKSEKKSKKPRNLKPFSFLNSHLCTLLSTIFGNLNYSVNDSAKMQPFLDDQVAPCTGC